METRVVEGSGGDLSCYKQAWNPGHSNSKRRKYFDSWERLNVKVDQGVTMLKDDHILRSLLRFLLLQGTLCDQANLWDFVVTNHAAFCSGVATLTTLSLHSPSTRPRATPSRFSLKFSSINGSVQRKGWVIKITWLEYYVINFFALSNSAVVSCFEVKQANFCYTYNKDNNKYHI